MKWISPPSLALEPRPGPVHCAGMTVPSGDETVTDATFPSPIRLGGSSTRTGTFLRSWRPAATVRSREAAAPQAEEAEQSRTATVPESRLVMGLVLTVWNPRLSRPGEKRASAAHRRPRVDPVGIEPWF